MTKQEIITKCIEAYTEAINVCSELDVMNAKFWLRSKCLNLGVCHYAETSLSQNIMYDDWVERHESLFTAYWTKTPSSCYAHTELMESLTTRLEILQRELSIPE